MAKKSATEQAAAELKDKVVEYIKDKAADRAEYLKDKAGEAYEARSKNFSIILFFKIKFSYFR